MVSSITKNIYLDQFFTGGISFLKSAKIPYFSSNLLYTWEPIKDIRLIFLALSKSNQTPKK